MLGDGIYEIFGGAYNCENAALAVSAANRLFGVNYNDSARALLSFRAPGRFELYTLYGKKIVIDYAHNRESVNAVLSYVSSFTEGRVIAVFGSVGMRSFDRREMLAKACEKHADFSVITADNPNFEPVESTCAEIYAHFEDKKHACVIPDRNEAIGFAVTMAKANDTVVLLGKGHESFQLIKGERSLFSERALIISMGARRI
jgi:UDP-N-acetylmuramoyl-L-alanyl-D-glutamate--2,6-diaminopimelate ligase